MISRGADTPLFSSRNAKNAPTRIQALHPQRTATLTPAPAQASIQLPTMTPAATIPAAPRNTSTITTHTNSRLTTSINSNKPTTSISSTPATARTEEAATIRAITAAVPSAGWAWVQSVILAVAAAAAGTASPVVGTTWATRKTSRRLTVAGYGMMTARTRSCGEGSRYGILSFV